MHITDPETLTAFIGGQMHFTLPTPLLAVEHVRLDIESIVPKDGCVIVSGRCYRQPQGETVWIETAQNTHRVNIISKDDSGSLWGQIRIIDRSGVFPIDTLANVLIYTAGDGRIITIDPLTRTVDDVLKSSHREYAIHQEHDGAVCGVVYAVSTDGPILPVVLHRYSIPGPAKARVHTVTSSDDDQRCVQVNGWVQHSDGGMNQGAVAASGFGATFAEAVANFRASQN